MIEGGESSLVPRNVDLGTRLDELKPGEEAEEVGYNAKMNP